MVWPEEAGIGAAPTSEAKAVRSGSGLGVVLARLARFEQHKKR
jgi:hypothetical protein